MAGAIFGEGHMMLECHFSWQGQCLVKLQCHFLWQAQHFVTFLSCNCDESHWQGCVNVSTGSKVVVGAVFSHIAISWQAWQFVATCSWKVTFRGRRSIW